MAHPAVIPLSAQTSRPKRNKHGRMVMLTPHETLELLKTAKNRSTRDWAMILLAYRHGLRASEVCGIKLADVDLKTGSISIRRLKGWIRGDYPNRPCNLCGEMCEWWGRTPVGSGEWTLFHVRTTTKHTCRHGRNNAG